MYTCDESGDRFFVRATALYILVWTLFRLWFSAQFELLGDEAYNWLWAHRLDWCYYSKGPIVALTTWIGVVLFGDTEFGVRFFNVILSAGIQFAIFHLARRLLSARTAFWSIVVFSLTPLFVVGSYVHTMDTPYLFFWVLAAIAFWKAKDSSSVPRWILVGLCVGLATLSKYTGLVQLAAFALFCAWLPAYRHHFRRPTFWLMLLTALACLTPVVLWNAQHQWCTVVHTMDRGQLDRPLRFSPKEFVDFVGLQVAVVFPLFFAGLVWSLLRRDLRPATPAVWPYLMSLMIPVFLMYTLSSFNDAGLPNWTAASYIPAFILMTDVWLKMADAAPSRRRLARITLTLAATLVVVIHVLLVYRLPMEQDLLRHHRGGKDLARQVTALQKEYDARILIGTGYQMTSLLSFYHPEHAVAFIPSAPGEIKNQFSLWPGYDQGHDHQNAIFVGKNTNVPPVLRREFKSVELIKETWSRYQGRPQKLVYLYLCKDYGPHPDAQP